MTKKWWKTTAIYQITLKSFFDGNNDGIGDFVGLTQKLDYIKNLGIGTIWVSPHYASPMDDNGYDVSDYLKVNPDFGTLDDFQIFVDAAHQKGLRVITDLVLNHTSDEHEWFQIACDPSHPEYEKYHDYYIWKPPKYDESGKRMRPTRWLSWFGGPTWDYVEAVDAYYLHIFSKKMPDLNWRNVEVRNEMKRIVQFWIDKGVDGFRIDASNHLEKNWDFPDGYPGYENFSDQPKHHEYLKELGKEYFVPNDLLAIGESGGATKEAALKYVGYGSNEFNLLIHFGHTWADTDDSSPYFKGKWGHGALRVSDIKTSFNHWYEILDGKGWNLIYWHNHDQPRIVSHYGNDKEYRVESAKMLAVALYFMPGTSITYQGEEIGMTNVLYNDISCFRDVEVFTEYQNFLDRGASVEDALQCLRDRSRDNARSPMQWTPGLYSGFSNAKPWMDVNYNYEEINVQDDTENPNSILATYKMILGLRKEEPENIVEGQIRFIDLDNQEHYSYINIGQTKDYLVLCNFKEYEVTVHLEQENLEDFEPFYSNTEERPLNPQFVLGPYQAFVYRKNK
ncbi:MAG: alpha-glucosidase [Bacilli bacterium]|nr:alpha-glucosidase [Bacilli bacterium]MBN2877402.1 alpha-glucosidase [Bacilli bacterium]